MHQDPTSLLRSLPTIAVYDLADLEVHLSSLTDECDRLRTRLLAARSRRAAAELEAQRGDKLRLHLGEAVLEAQSELDAGRDAYEQAITELVAATDLEVERILAEAQAEADALRSALGQLRPEAVDPREVDLREEAGESRSVRIAAEQTPAPLELVRNDSLVG